MGHKRHTIVFQRELLNRTLAGRIDITPLPRRAYEEEMRHAQAVISPFGWGEYAIRDYEAMVSGAALVKPDMGHLETWPDLYRNGETYRAVDWEFQELPGVLDDLAHRPSDFLRLAQSGQEALRDAQRDGAAFAAQVASALAPW